MKYIIISDELFIGNLLAIDDIDLTLARTGYATATQVKGFTRFTI